MENAIDFESETRSFLEAITGFFDLHSIVDRLDFFNNWVNPITIDAALLQQDKPAALFQFYEQLLSLLKRAEIISTGSQKDFVFLKAIQMDAAALKKEKVLINYQPKYLSEAEMVNPWKALVSVFCFHDQAHYQQNYKNWLLAALAGDTSQDWDEYTYPVYENTKKMLEACWLIHERIISKNSSNSIDFHYDLAVFENTSPLCLSQNLDANPFEVIEDFFNLDDLAGHKTYLKNWYRAALAKEERVRNPSDYLFIYNQFTRLLYAGYLIASRKLFYDISGKELRMQLATYKENRIGKGEYHAGQYEINVLPVRYVNNPYGFIALFFVPEKIKRLRLGLLEWLYAAFSAKNSIKLMDKEFLFEQYETLLMLTEAFFLMITQPFQQEWPVVPDQIA